MRHRTLNLTMVAFLAMVVTGPLSGVGWSWSAPRWAAEAFERADVQLETSGTTSRFVVTAHVNPSVLFGDFDGDSRTDVACLVRERKSGKVGIAVAMQGEGGAFEWYQQGD